MNGKAKMLCWLVVLTQLFACNGVDKDDKFGSQYQSQLKVDIANLLSHKTEIFEHAPKSSNMLAFDLYGKLKDKVNPTFSPFSISLALAMTYAGANGKTEQEMKNVLHFKDNTSSFHKSYGEFANFLTHKDRSKDKTVFKISNTLWLQNGFKILDDFKKILANDYAARPIELDFENNPKLSTETINQAVSKQTDGEINKLLEKLENNTRLVITNAIYFNSEWYSKFKERNTEADNFTKADKSKINANYMKQVNYISYGEDKDKQFLVMPYKDEEFATLFVLPREGKLQETENSLTETGFNNMLSSAKGKR